MRRLRSIVLLCALLSACGPPRDTVGIENPDIPASSVEQLAEKRGFIATTRAPSQQEGTFFSSMRSSELGLASVVVTIPLTHEAGKLEYPHALPPDPRTELTIVEPVRYGSDSAFLRALNAALRERPPGKRDILLFIHGYNNSTSDAVLRVGQFVHDSGFEGVPVLLSWASAAQPVKYVYDLNSVLVARDKVPEIRRLLDRADADSFDLFAHSMGSLLAMEGLVDGAKQGIVDTPNRLQNVILAAPDIDLDLFRSQLNQLQTPPYRLFVLLSEDDTALRISRILAGGVTRVGSADADELRDFGVVVVDLTEVDDRSSSSHLRFANSPDVVQLIGNSLNRIAQFETSESEQRLDVVLIGASIRVLF